MKALSAEAVRRYDETGYYAPVSVLDTGEAAAIRTKLEAHEAAHGRLTGHQRHKSHLLFTWLDQLIRNERILDAVEDVIGPDILCWGTSFFIKEPRNPGFVSWHQDSTYWGLDPADIVTAWVALSDSTAENGAMRVVPGTHKLEQVAHRDTFAPDNLLSRGQEIAVDVDEAKAVMLELKAGEMSLHHGSVSPSVTCRPMCARWWAPPIPPRWFAAPTASATSSRSRAPTETFPPPHSPSMPASPASTIRSCCAARRRSARCSSAPARGRIRRTSGHQGRRNIGGDVQWTSQQASSCCWYLWRPWS